MTHAIYNHCFDAKTMKEISFLLLFVRSIANKSIQHTKYQINNLHLKFHFIETWTYNARALNELKDWWELSLSKIGQEQQCSEKRDRDPTINHRYMSLLSYIIILRHVCALRLIAVFNIPNPNPNLSISFPVRLSIQPLCW